MAANNKFSNQKDKLLQKRTVITTLEATPTPVLLASGGTITPTPPPQKTITIGVVHDLRSREQRTESSWNTIRNLANNYFFNQPGLNMNLPSGYYNNSYSGNHVLWDCSDEDEDDLINQYGEDASVDKLNIVLVSMFDPVSCNSAVGIPLGKFVFTEKTVNGQIVPDKRVLVIAIPTDPNIAANTLSHEFGHFARLPHACSSDNIMKSGSTGWNLSASENETPCQGPGSSTYLYSPSPNRNQYQYYRDWDTANDNW